MLGLSSGLIKGASTLRSIVKSGLQAWYKSDRTQAPLGEEQVVNGNFNAGSNLLPSINDLSSWVSQDAEQVSDGIKISFSESSGSTARIQYLESNWGNYVHDSDYIVEATVTGGAGSTGKKFKIQDHTSNAGGLTTTLTGDIVMTEGVSQSVEFYFKANSSSNTLALTRDTSSGSDYDFTVNSLTLKQTNPNNNWSVYNTNDHSTITFKKNNKVEFRYDDTAATSAIGISQEILNVGSRYIATLTIEDLEPHGSTVTLQDGSTDALNNELKVFSGSDEVAGDLRAGTHTFEFVATNDDFYIYRDQISKPCRVSLSNVSVRKVTNSIKDFSSNSNDATLYSGTALDFDGSADVITLGDLGDANKTLAFWFNPDATIDSSTSGAQFFGFSTSYFGIILGQATADFGGETFTVLPGATSRTATGLNFTAGRWYRMAIVWNSVGSYYDIYRDGVLITDPLKISGTHTLSNWSNFQIAKSAGSSTYFDGKLSDIQIYDKAWTASDVTFDYNNPDKDVFDNTNSSISPSNCKALYRLNEGAGSKLYNAAPILSEELLTGNISLSGGDATGFDFVNSATANNANSTDDFLDVTSGPGDNNLIQQVFSTTVGSLYSIKAELVQSFEGTGFAIGAKNNDTGASLGASTFSSTPRVAEFIFKATGANTALQLKSGGASKRVQIRNVSVKEITLATNVAQTSWTSSNWVVSQPYIPQYAKSSFSRKIIFDGAFTSINCGSDSSIDDVFAGSGGTWSCWVSTLSEGESGNGNVLTKGNVHIRITDDGGSPCVKFLKSFDGGSDGNWRTPLELSYNKLMHIAVTYDSDDPNNDPKIYINGIEQTITENSTPAGNALSDASNNFLIGGSGSNNYHGFIDEISIFNKMLTIAEVKEIFNRGTALDVRDHSAYSNLVAYWRNNGTNTWTDLSTNSNDADGDSNAMVIKFQEVPLFNKDTLGLPMNRLNEGSLNFDGDGYASISSNPSLTSDSVSVECWIKLKEAPQILLGAVSKYQANATKPWLLGITASRYVKWFQNGGNDPIVADSSTSDRLSLGTWRHIAVTYDGSVSTNNARQIFIDGELRASESKVQGVHDEDGPIVDTHNTEVEIGRYALQASKSDNAYIDDVKIYNRVLTTDEVKRNYKATKGRHKN